MKELINIHDYLVSAESMDYWQDDAFDAADRFNHIMHTTYDMADENISTQQLERILIKVSEFWVHDQELLNIDDDEINDWIHQHLLNADQDEDDEATDENPQDY